MGKAPYSSRIKLGALDQGSPSLRFQSGISRPTFKNSVGDGRIRTHTTLRSTDFKSRESVLPNLTRHRCSSLVRSSVGYEPSASCISPPTRGGTNVQITRILVFV